MDLNNLKPVEFAPKQTIPALFVHGIDDELIPMDHTEKNQEAYAGPKDVSFCEGDHNSQRPKETMEQTLNFLVGNLKSQ